MQNYNIHEIIEENLIILLKFGSNEKIREFVLQHSSSINLNYLNLRLKTPLMALVDREDPEILRLFLENISIDLNDVTLQPSKRTILMYASFMSRKSEILQEFLRKNADPWQTDLCGWTCLQYAIIGNKLKNVLLLLNYSLPKEIKDFTGRTPLMIAVLFSNLEIIQIILKYGADINAYDNLGLSAVQLAIMYRKRDVALFLLQNGADITQVTPLTKASLKDLSNTTMPKLLPKIQIEENKINFKPFKLLI